MQTATVRRQLVLRALPQWNITPDAMSLRHHGENTVYVVRVGAEKLIARLSGADLQNAISVRGELRFIEHCVARGIHAARPVPTTRGDMFARISELVPETGHKRDRLITLFPYLPGRRIGRSGMTDSVVFKWGATIAELQNATIGFRQTKSARRPDWDQIIFQRELLSPDLARRSWFRQEWEASQAWLHALPRTEFGLIHADVHEGNFKIHHGEFYLFDFDDSCVCWYAYDLAVVLLRFSGASENAWLANFRAQLMAGYRSVRPLSDEGEARIAGLVRARRLWIANWLTMRSDIPRLRRYYQDYMIRLRFLVARETSPFE